jgi:hypothetical protein
MSIPLQPQNVILQTGNGQILLTWNIVAGATSYQVQRSTDGVTFVNYATPAGNSFLDSVVFVGVEYFYQVASVNLSGTSGFTTPYPTSIVPCLPGQINLGYLRYMAQLRADKLNSPYLTTDEWNWNINQSGNGLYDFLVKSYGDDYFFAPPLQIALTGLPFYPLPDGSNYSGAPALYKLNGIDANISGQAPGPNAGWVPLSRFNWSDRDKYTTFPGQAGALNNIYQMAYREMGSNLFIIPTNQNMLIQMWYVPIMKQLLRDTDMLPFSISGWSEYIIVEAAMKAMIKEESLEKYTALQANKTEIELRIQTMAKNRDVGQPNSVSNIRATAGDPGFGNQGFGNGFSFGGFGG